MKKILFLLISASSILFTHAQKINEKNVPPVVKATLQKQFPTAKNVIWEKEKENYEAGFKINETNYSALLTPAGDMIETEIEISVTALATSITNYIAKHYPKQKIKEAAKITNAKGEVTYEAEVNNKDLIFDHSGKFLKEIKD